MHSQILPQSFYARDALDVARDLIGKIIRHEDVILRITETEAYRHPNDTANHCRFGKTKRNLVMFGPPGHAYIYLCYGLHHMLNFVTGFEEEGAAVLIRSCEQVIGPGRVGKALRLTTTYTHHPLFEPGGLEVLDAPAPQSILQGPRVGIDYADKIDREAPWRFGMADTAWVSMQSKLKAE